MGGRGGGGRTQVSSPGAARDENRILRLTTDLEGVHRESWVSLAQLRDNLSGMSRERQDAAIARLLKEGRIGLTSEQEPRQVRARERNAAFRHAGVNYHLLRVRRNS